VEYKRRQSSWLYLLAGPLAVGLFGLSAWLLWTAGKPIPKIKSLLDTPGNQALTRDVAAAQRKPVAVAKPAPLIEQGKPEVALQANTDLVARTNFAAQPSLSPTTLPAPKLIQEVRPFLPARAEVTRIEGSFPKLKLQGIYFRRTNPSVLINGRTLFIGDRVEGTRVVTIDRQTVTVEFGGQISLLTL
jgi:hypothetical protein